MKNLFLFIFLTFSAVFTLRAQPDSLPPEPAKNVPPPGSFTSIEVMASYPGGNGRFMAYVQNALRYPELAQLMGTDTKVMSSFVVEKDGHIDNVKALDEVGSDYEKEAVRVLTNSMHWSPGMQNGTTVPIHFNIPVRFFLKKDSIQMKELRKSNLGFVFQIKGIVYSVDEAEALLGKSFSATLISSTVPYSGTEKRPKRKTAYIISIKTE